MLVREREPNTDSVMVVAVDGAVRETGDDVTLGPKVVVVR